jgi:peptidoglycan/LPS O-acetylase OafA/YrhL
VPALLTVGHIQRSRPIPSYERKDRTLNLQASAVAKIEHPVLTSSANQSVGARPHYRPDIDGLRAIAVLAVVFYHYRFSGFGGGFVGVDVFFVISGYLITGLIYGEMKNGRFSLVSFYERRVRRIFPALFALLALVSLLSLLILLPSDFIGFGKSLAAAAFFSANLLFWHQGGYFDAVSTVKPLLHTWSLAVEEQFYLIFPPLLFVIRKASRHRLLCFIGLIFLASLAESAVGIKLSPFSTFYLLPARMWELMLGALLALGNCPSPRTKLARDFLGAAGLSMILIAVVLYGDDTPFPGPTALLPCVGTALVIYSGLAGESIVSNALSMRVPVAIGLISYSLYLWHWPLYVFGNYFALNGLSVIEKIALISLSILLAWGSYRYVESPFRGKTGAFSRPILFKASALAMGMFVICGAGIAKSGGFLWRYDAQVGTLAAGAFDVEPSLTHCFELSFEKIQAGALCRIGDAHAPVSFLLWGDSHAGALAPAISDAAAQRGVSGLVVSQSACGPLLGVDRSDGENCREFNQTVAQFLDKKPDIIEVILAARWARDALGTPYDHETGHLSWLRDDNSATQSLAENRAVFARGLDRTLSFLSQEKRKAVVIGPVPEVGWSVPETSAKLALLHSSFDIRPQVLTFQNRQQYVLGVIDALQEKYGLTILSPADVLCGPRHCDVEANGRPYYVDGHHLAVFGAEQLVPLLERAFPNPGNQSIRRARWGQG